MPVITALDGAIQFGLKNKAQVYGVSAFVPRQESGKKSIVK